MKLDTEIKGGKLMVDGVYIDHQNIEWFQALQVSHDAACAHALMQAMTALNGAGWSRLRNPVAEIRERADELMREWGFDSGEVE